MDLVIKAIILGIVEGVTEFLPISSTGHLIIFGHFLNFSGAFAVTFEIVIQLGAILAVLFFYWNRIMDSLKNLKPGKWGFQLWLWILIAFLPSAVLGIVTNDFVEKFLFSPLTVSIAMIFGAVLILIVERVFRTAKIQDIQKIGGKRSFYIGLAQCLSLFPGMSRSASTIMGGLIAGLSVKAAAEFSFFLAIPTMFAATGYSLVKGVAAMSTTQWLALAIGFVVSFMVAFLVVGKFLSFLGKYSLKPFAYYRLIIGIVMVFIVVTGLI